MIRSHGKITHAGTQVACSGTFKTKQLVAVNLDPPLFWKFHRATCVPACVIVYHVTGSCKGPITSVFQAFSKLVRSAKNSERRKIGVTCGAPSLSRLFSLQRVFVLRSA